MLRVPIRSRIGNGVLGTLGAIYVLSASVVFVYYLVSSWGAIGPIDLVLQAGLIASAIGGLLFIAIAFRNLGITPQRAEKSRSARDRQTAAAAES
jgi:hypothetical protein